MDQFRKEKEVLTCSTPTGAWGRVPAMSKRMAALPLSAFFLVNLVILVVFADRDGFEGDDINSVVPMFHLPEAREGLILSYRIAWQPLTYELGSWVYQWFQSPDAVFLLAPICGAIALGLLFFLTQLERQEPDRAWLPGLLLLLIPELWFSSLYFNSSIIGMPFAVGAAILIRHGPRNSEIGAGLLLGLAIAFRIDFVLSSTVMAALAWGRHRRILPVVLLTATTMAPLVFFWGVGILSIEDMLTTFRISSAEIIARSDQLGWDLRFKIFVWTVVFSPIGWLFVLAGGPVAAIRKFKQDPVLAGLFFLSIFPALWPMRHLLTPKYILPVAVFWPIFSVYAFTSLTVLFPRPRTRTALLAILGANLVFLVLAVSPQKNVPFISVHFFEPGRTIETHDGPRGYGAYLTRFAQLDPEPAEDPKQAQGREWADQLMLEKGPDLAFRGEENVFTPGGTVWRHGQLELERRGLQGSFVEPGVLVFEHQGRRLWMLNLKASLPSSAPEDLQVVDLVETPAEPTQP